MSEGESSERQRASSKVEEMTESTADSKDSFEENTSSEEWTIIDRRGSKDKEVLRLRDSTKENVERKDLNSDEKIPAEETVTDDTQIPQDSKEEGDNGDTEKAEESDVQDDKENEAESDDVSIISEDEHADNAGYQEKRIQKLERNKTLKKLIKEKLDQQTILPLDILILLFISVTFFGVIGIIITSREINSEDSHYKCAFDSYKKIKSFSENFDQFHQMADRLDNLHSTWPKIQDHVEGLSESIKNFMNLKISLEDSLTNVKNRAELVAALYMNFCLITNRINSVNPQFKPRECRVPNTIEGFIYHKNRYGKDTELIREAVARDDGPQEFARAKLEAEEKIDVIVESLLSKFIDAFSIFAKEVESSTGPIEYINFTKDQILKNEYMRNEKEYNQEVTGEKSKGEVKNDNWKKNKYENNEKYEEKKYKREKYENQKKNKNPKQKRDYDDFQIEKENDFHKDVENDFQRKYEGNKKERDYDRKHDYDKKNPDVDRQSYRKKKNKEFYDKKERDSDYKYKKNKKEYDFERKFEHNKKVPDYENKSEHEKNYDEYEFEYKNKKDNAYRERDHKKYCPSGHKCNSKEYHDDGNDDRYSKYTKNSEHRFVESNKANEYLGKSKEDQSGEWLMDRANERAKQRNSYWYSARADSRQEARRKTTAARSNNKNDHEDHRQQQQQQQQQQQRRSTKYSSNSKESSSNSERWRGYDDD